MQNEKLIEVKNLNFSYDKKYQLKISNLTLPPKKIITLLGPSGSGKTTFLNLIAGFLNSNNQIVNYKSFENIGYIMQKNNLYEQVSVIKNLWISTKNSTKWTNSTYKKIISDSNKLTDNNKQKLLNNLDQQSIFLNKSKKFYFKIYKYKFWLTLLLRPKLFLNFLKQRKQIFESQVDNLLKILQIENIKFKKASQISGGQQQRVAFAKAIIKGNDLVLMDEPFASLDAKIKESTIKWLENIKNQFDLSIIFVTHDQVDALKISDLVVLLKDGEIAQFGTPQELFENPKNLFVAKFIGNPEIIFLGKHNEIESYIRGKYIKVSKGTTNEVISSKNIGDGFLTKIFYKKHQVQIELITTENFENEFVELEYDESKVLFFDKQGQRVYEL